MNIKRIRLKIGETTNNNINIKALQQSDTQNWSYDIVATIKILRSFPQVTYNINLRLRITDNKYGYDKMW